MGIDATIGIDASARMYKGIGIPYEKKSRGRLEKTLNEVNEITFAVHAVHGS